MLGLSLIKTLEPHSHSISVVPNDFSSCLPHLIHLYMVVYLLYSLAAIFRCIGPTGKFIAAMPAFPYSIGNSLYLFLLA